MKQSIEFDEAIHDSYDLLCFLRRKGFLDKKYHDELEFWWPGYGNFEVIIGTILAQNTQWNKVAISLANLKKNGDLSLEYFLTMEEEYIMHCIQPSGLYRKKAKTLYNIAQAIKNNFGSFQVMQAQCTRKWLLEQKGIGQESADSIMCYALKREEMVADNYAYRLLKNIGIELETYQDIKEWLEYGIRNNKSKVAQLYPEKNFSLHYVFARFHGKIDEFGKEYKI